MDPLTKLHPQNAQRSLKTKRRFFSIFQTWSTTPLGIITLIGLLVLAVEVITMQVIFSNLAPSAPIGFPKLFWNILDASVLTLAVTPTLYFLIFRRVSQDADKFLKITSVAQDAVVVMDSRGSVSFWNASAERIFGYTAEEAMGKDLHVLVAPPKSLNAFSANFQHFVETGDGPILYRVREVIAQRKSGEQFHAELSVSAMLINGEWNAVGVIRDISIRKKREETLKERDEELAQINNDLSNKKAEDEAILESLGEGMIVTDKLGNIITVNHATEKMLGLSKEEMLNKKILDIILAVDEQGNKIPDEERPIYTTLSTGLSAFAEKLRFIKKDGGTIPVSTTSTPVILNGELRGAVIIFRDITKEEELEITRRDLLSLASHQLRTPLSGTKWLIETMRNKLLGPLTEKQEEYLEQIYRINVNMTELVHDMLGVLRMEGDITQAKKENVSLATLFGLILETLGPAAKDKKVNLHIDKSDEFMIQSDGLLLRQILESLISNAINYSSPMSEVYISTNKTPYEFVFSVKDSGIGIPKEEQHQIFQRFYRASNAKTFDTRGTGLGLYIASTLAKKIGANLTFESERDKGSTFYLHVPIIAAENQQNNMNNIK